MNADYQSSHHSPDLWISSGIGSAIVILCRTELFTCLTSGGVPGATLPCSCIRAKFPYSLKHFHQGAWWSWY